ncbi:hypothetical protein NPX13_g2762 [Xylaria arbuscula]|uniref:LysM domain-containing protein n=1 Tax=Xylaria arbuscula TaxID=114810 RepID=A0A9W8NJG7_9PEZI|nr:hypothetical protein NPX13_g2762 [Xylaria arbuscula]
MKFTIAVGFQAAAWTFVTGQSVQLVSFEIGTNSTISATCEAVMNQNVTCDASLLALGQLGLPHGLPELLPSSQLTSLCTTTCSASLATWERRIQGACGTQYWPDSDGSGGSFLLSERAERFVEIYNAICLKNSAGIGCNSEIASILSFDAANQNFTGTPPDSAFCNTCILSVLQTQLAMPLASRDDIATYFSSLTSSCGSTTGFSPSPPQTATIFTMIGSPTPTTSCDGKTYTIIGWNPSLGVGCQGLESAIGYVICVSTPGGDWVNPNTTEVTTVAPPPSTLPQPTLLTGSLTAMTLLPAATYIPYTSNETTPYANSTRMDCISYITAPFLVDIIDNNNTVTSSSCSDAAAAYGLSLSDFLLWNPDLNGINPCVLANNTKYCAQASTVQAQNITESCIQTQIPEPGYSCLSFVAQAGIDPNQFTLWNPSVGSDCSNFQPGLEYCVAVYHYQQPGITSNCNKFVVANDTNWANSPCQIIETKFGLSHARFVAWNPSVLSNCTEIYSGYDYCVSIPNYVPTYSSTTTSSPTLTVASVNTAHAIVTSMIQ